jgi:hypothetical protein
MSNDMRAKGIGVFKLTAGTAGFVNAFAAAVAFSNLSGLFAGTWTGKGKANLIDRSGIVSTSSL